MRVSAKPRRFTSCVSAPDATGRSSACWTVIFPSISQMAQSLESCGVASGAGCGLTDTVSCGVTLGIAVRTPLFGFTNSPDVFLPWARRKIAPSSNQNWFLSCLCSVSHWKWSSNSIKVPTEWSPLIKKNCNRLWFNLWMHYHTDHAMISGYLLMQGNAAVFVACFAKAWNMCWVSEN